MSNRYIKTVSGFQAFVALALALTFVVGLLYGYINNIAELVHATGFTGMVVARAIGIFVPFIGVVLGYV